MKSAVQIIDDLGGSAEVSRATGFPLTTIESWKAAGSIPEWRRAALLTIAASRAIALSADDFPARKTRTLPTTTQELAV